MSRQCDYLASVPSSYFIEVLLCISIKNVFLVLPCLGLLVKRQCDNVASVASSYLVEFISVINVFIDLFWSACQQIRDDLQKLMRTVATLLCRDFNLTLGDASLQQRIDTFVNDVFTFERDLANVCETHRRLVKTLVSRLY